jgi:hypothetical protein
VTNVEFRRDDLAHDSRWIDHEGHAARGQPAARPGHAIVLGDLHLGIAHQRKGEIQRVGEGGVAPLRIAADADDLGAQRSELRVLSPEVTRLERSAGCKILRIEVEDQWPLLQELRERDATSILDRRLESRCYVSLVNHNHLVERRLPVVGETSVAPTRDSRSLPPPCRASRFRSPSAALTLTEGTSPCYLVGCWRFSTRRRGAKPSIAVILNTNRIWSVALRCV